MSDIINIEVAPVEAPVNINITVDPASGNAGNSIDQNNVTRTIQLTFLRDRETERIPSRQYVTSQLNLRNFTISEIQTPVLIRVVELAPNEGHGDLPFASSTHIFLFLKGKGVYGFNATTVRPADVFYLSTQSSSVEDLENAGNTKIIDLGILPNDEYLAAANAFERDLNDSSKIYFFQYFKDDKSYLVRVINALGYFGGSYPNQLTNENLLPAVGSGDPIISQLELGENEFDAYRGDRGKVAYDHTRIAGNPHATQMADIPLLNTWLNDRLIGSRATDAEVQATAAPTAQNKYVDIIRLFNWFAWIKTQAWNFTGTLKKNNVDVATVNDLASYANDYRRFHFAVTQTNNTIMIGPLFEKLTVNSIIQGEGTSLFDRFQVKKPGTTATIRDTQAQLQSDINALTAAQVTAGYTIIFRVVLVAGQSLGAGVFMAVKQA